MLFTHNNLHQEIVKYSEISGEVHVGISEKDINRIVLRRYHLCVKQCTSTPYLYTVLPPIHVVAQEEEGGWGEEGTHPPQGLLKTHQVTVVTMNITYTGKNVNILNRSSLKYSMNTDNTQQSTLGKLLTKS